MLDFEGSSLRVDLYIYHSDLSVIITNTCKYSKKKLPVRAIIFCHFVEPDPTLLLLVELFSKLDEGLSIFGTGEFIVLVYINERMF